MIRDESPRAHTLASSHVVAHDSDFESDSDYILHGLRCFETSPCFITVVIDLHGRYLRWHRQDRALCNLYSPQDYHVGRHLSVVWPSVAKAW